MHGLKSFIYFVGISALCLLCLFLGEASSSPSLSERLDETSTEIEEDSPLIKRISKRQAEEGSAPSNGGATYVRWGRYDCPAEANTQLVYDGYAAGNHHTHHGGGSNLLCLDKTIDYSDGGYLDGFQDSSYLYGVQYYMNNAHSSYFFNFVETGYQSTFSHNVPCAICMANQRYTQLMIPGQRECPAGWTMEYRGWIMAEAHGHRSSQEYVCVDQSPQVVPGSQDNTGGSLLYMVETSCPSLQCQPFVNGRELRCVVCSI